MGLGTVCSDSQESDVYTLAPDQQITAGQWMTAATPAKPPIARGGCAYGVLENHAVCAGGEASSSALPTVDAYDLVAGTWQSEPNMPAPRAGIQGAVIGTRLFVPGGAAMLTAPITPTDTLFVFSPLDLVSGP